MSEFEIICKITNNEGKIKKLKPRGIDSIEVEELIRRIDKHPTIWRYFTYVAGEKAYLEVVDRQGSRYLRTNKDTTEINNLEELNECGK